MKTKFLFAIFAACAVAILSISCTKNEEHTGILAAYDIKTSLETDLSRIYVTENVTLNIDVAEPISSVTFVMNSLLYEESDKSAYTSSQKKRFKGGETEFGGVSVNGMAAQTELSGREIIVALPEPVAQGEVTINFGYTSLVAESESVYGRSDGSVRLFDCYPTLAPFDGKEFLSYEFNCFSNEFGLNRSEYKMTYYTPISVSIATDLEVTDTREEELQKVTECRGSSYSPGAIATEKPFFVDGNVVTDNEKLFPYLHEFSSSYAAATDSAPTHIKVISTPLGADFMTKGSVVMISDELFGERLINAAAEGVARTYFYGTSQTSDAMWVSEGLPYFLSVYRLSGSDEYSERLREDEKLVQSVTEFLRGYNPNYTRFPFSAAESFTTIPEYNAVVRAGTALAMDTLIGTFGEKKVLRAIRSLTAVPPLTTDEAILKMSKSLGRGSEAVIREALSLTAC